MIAVVLVTHNSLEFLPELLASIDRQTLQPELKLAVDDNSTDRTVELLTNNGFTVIPAQSVEPDTTTRIAQNFVQVVTAATAAGADAIIIGDHDDLWHPHRIKHQSEFLRTHERAHTRWKPKDDISSPRGFQSVRPARPMAICCQTQYCHRRRERHRTEPNQHPHRSYGLVA
jgi:glycosyltransferase involved in cell wall biosynthesis